MRRPLIACCLCLVLWPASAQAPSLDFAGDRYVKQQEDAKPGDIFVIFGLAGETEKTWTKRIVFTPFPTAAVMSPKASGS
jgi:hypothetical protein